MVSPASGFAQGLERGWRIGESAERSRYQKEDREYTKKQRDLEARVNAEIGKALAFGVNPEQPPAAGSVAQSQPVAPVAMPEPTGLSSVPKAKPAAMPEPAGLDALPGTKPVVMPGTAPSAISAPVSGLESAPARPRAKAPDYVAQVNGSIGYLLKAASDPANAEIAAALYDKAGVIAQSSKRFGDVMLQQARQKAMPHIQALYNPGATDEQKTAAVGALMNEVFPDGETYQPKVVGKEVHLLDASGKPVMGADGKPRVISMDEVDEMLTYGLSTPDDYIASVQESIKSRREQALADAKLKEQRAYDEGKEERTYRRNRADELDDRAYTAGVASAKEDREAARALEKEGRDEKRDAVKAKRNFIAKAMAAYDKDAAFSAPNPEARAAYLEQVRATANEQFGGGVKRPVPTGLQPGDAIEVDVEPGLGADAPTRAPTAAPPALPQIPMPGQAAEAPAGPSGATYNPEIGRGVDEISAGLDALQGWKEKRRTSGYREMAEKFRQGASTGKVDPALVQRLRTVPDRVLARDYGLSPEEIAVIKRGS